MFYRITHVNPSIKYQEIHNSKEEVNKALDRLKRGGIALDRIKVECYQPSWWRLAEDFSS